MQRTISAFCILMSVHMPGAAHAAAIADPKRVSLQVSDLPPGFVADTQNSKYLDNRAATTKDRTIAQILRSGRELGYVAQFDRTTQPGLAIVLSYTELYASARQARQRFITSATKPGPGLTAVPMSAVGDMRLFLRARDKQTGWEEDYAYFVRGPYRVMVYLEANPLSGSIGQVLKLARILDNRIQRTL